MDNWYSRVKEEIKKQQEDPVWMSEDKVIYTYIYIFFFSSIFLILWLAILFFFLAADSVTFIFLWTVFVLLQAMIFSPF